jgi:hypothetical protein
MDDFARKSLARLWGVAHFKCDDAEVVERCWIFKDGTMMVRSIPLIITQTEESSQMNEYQEAVVEFDRNGKITSVDGQDPFALEKPQRDMNDDGEVVDYCRWTRDAQGQIDSILCYEYMDEYRWHDGRVTQVLSGYEGQLWLTDREYDADGRLVKTKQYEVVETDGPEEVNLMWVTEYTYLEFDDRGNWIRRKQTDTDQVVEYVNETEVSREIEYY